MLRCGHKNTGSEKIKRYPSDLSDAEWHAIELLLPKPEKKGRRHSVNLREAVNAIRYLIRSGCALRFAPCPRLRSTLHKSQIGTCLTTK